MKLMNFTLLAGLLMALGCRSDEGGVAAGGNSNAPLVGTEWTLSSMDFEGGFLVMSSARQHPTLTLTQADPIEVSGYAGINRFTGTCTVGEDGGLSFSPLATTRMAGPPDHMRLEQAFLEHLAGATQFDLDAGELSITTAQGQLLFHPPATGD